MLHPAPVVLTAAKSFLSLRAVGFEIKPAFTPGYGHHFSIDTHMNGFGHRARRVFKFVCSGIPHLKGTG